MRKLTTIIIGGLLLAGCTTETIVREVPATDPPTTAPPATEAPRNMVTDYLDYVNAMASDAIYNSDADLLEVGGLVCDALDNDASVREVVDVMEEQAITEGDRELFAVVLFAAVTFLCPHHTDALDHYIGSI